MESSSEARCGQGTQSSAKPRGFDYIGLEPPNTRTPDESLEYTSLSRSTPTIRLIQLSQDYNCHYYANISNLELHQWSLRYAPPYVALSYHWGKEEDQTYENEREMCFRHAKNLRRCLSQIRIPKNRTLDPLWLWVDAICINQADTEELSSQVQIMRDIYSRAEWVIAWLGETAYEDVPPWCGPGKDKTERAFRLINKCKQDGFVEDIVGYFDSCDYNKSIWFDLRNLLCREYWHRVWIIQEFIVAKRVELWCGKHFADLDLLCRLGQALELHQNEISDMWHREVFESPGWKLIQHRLKWWCGRGPETIEYRRFSLQEVLRTFEASRTSNPRDRIYGLLGLVHSSVVPDYRKSMAEIALDVVRDQCRFGDPEEEQKHVSFINQLRIILEIPQTKLLQCARARYPDLTNYLHLIVGPECLTTSLTCLSTIIKIDFDIGEHCVPRKSRAKATNTRAQTIHIPPWRSNLLDSSETRSMLKIHLDPSSQGYLLGDATILPSHREDSTYPWKLGKDNEASPFLGLPSLNISDPRYAEWRPHFRFDPHSEYCGATKQLHTEDFRIFVGTDGIVGIASSVIEPGDHLFVKSDSQDANGAFILRQNTSEDLDVWKIVGPAVYLRLQEAPAGDASDAADAALTPSGKQLIYSSIHCSQDNEKCVSESDVSAKGVEIEYYFHTPYLPRVLRCLEHGRQQSRSTYGVKPCKRCLKNLPFRIFGPM